MVLEVEARVVDPARAADPGRRVGELLAVARRAVEAAADVREEVVERRRLAAEDRDAADVHVRRRALLEQERRVERAQRVEVLLRRHRSWRAYRDCRGLRGPHRPLAASWSRVSSRLPARSRPDVRRRRSVQGRPRHRLLVRHRTRDRRAAGRARLDRLRDGAPPRVDRRPRGAGLPAARSSTSPTRHSMRAAVGAVEAEHGAVGALVNNAGYSQSGAIETVGIDDVRRQFETNVFGLVRLTPARAAGDARPALGQDRERLVDGRELHVPRRRLLPRDEVRARGDQRRAALRGHGLRRRRRRDPARASSAPGSATPRSPRSRTAPADGGPVRRASTTASPRRRTDVYEKGPLSKLGGGPEDVAKTIERAITARRPKIRYRVTPSARTCS